MAPFKLPPGWQATIDENGETVIDKVREEAEYVPEQAIPAQSAKPIQVDDDEYEPGYGVTMDWALNYYQDYGGES
jgi:hypothetical protein